MSNSDRFLHAFNQIERRLRAETSSGPEAGFVGMVRVSRNPIVRRYDQDLREYAELRNAIVHGRSGKILAEPNDGAVVEIEHIATVMTQPPRLDRVIPRRVVATTSPTAPIREPVLAMRRGDFSQIPVYLDDRFEALLTAETVSRWVADGLERDGGILDEALVADVLPHAENGDNFALVDPSATVYQAIELFDDFRRKGKVLDAIIVAQGGRRDVKPLNIVTIYDVPALFDVS